jgi:hypothetical protein
MRNDDLRVMARTAKRNYNISQAFTALSAIAVFYLLYCTYFSVSSKVADSLSFYLLLSMTAISIILSWIYSKKLRQTQFVDIIKKAITDDIDLVKQFAKAKAQEGCCLFLLIVAVVASFFLSGTHLCYIDDIGFLLIIFNFWNANRNQNLFFDMLVEKNII